MVSNEGDTMQSTAVAYPLEDLQGWERTLVAFLVEKERLSGSRRTVEGYSRMLQDFFGRLGRAPDQVTSQGSSFGRTPSVFRAKSPPPSPSVPAWPVSHPSTV
jgi:hypothetical protein